MLVLVGAPSMLLNRAIIPALPGSRSGIESLLDRTLALGSLSSQLLALTLTLLLVRLVVSSIGAASVGALDRLFVLPIGSAVGFLVVAASAGTLEPELHLLLAVVSGLGLVICCRSTLRHPSTRSGGILLLLVTLTSVLYGLARLVAVRASLDAVARTYLAARWLATAGQVFDLACLTWVAAWLVVSQRNQGLLRVGIATALAAGLSILSQMGRGLDASFTQVVAARGLLALAREPKPFGVELFAHAEVMALSLSLGLIWIRNPDTSVLRRAMALLLLSRSSLDVPALAGMATAGALLLAWFSPSRVVASTGSENSSSNTSRLDESPSDVEKPHIARDIGDTHAVRGVPIKRRAIAGLDSDGSELLARGSSFPHQRRKAARQLAQPSATLFPVQMIRSDRSSHRTTIMLSAAAAGTITQDATPQR